MPGNGVISDPKLHRSSISYKLWPLVNAIMGLFFFLASIAQVHDPDPLVWMAIYIVPAFLCFSITCLPEVTDNIWWKRVAIIHLLCCFGECTFLAVQLFFWFKDRLINPLRYEEGREFCGITVVMVWLAICKCHTNHRGSSTARTSFVTWITLILGLLPMALWVSCCVSSINHCTDMW